MKVNGSRSSIRQESVARIVWNWTIIVLRSMHIELSSIKTKPKKKKKFCTRQYAGTCVIRYWNKLSKVIQVFFTTKTIELKLLAGRCDTFHNNRVKPEISSNKTNYNVG